MTRSYLKWIIVILCFVLLTICISMFLEKSKKECGNKINALTNPLEYRNSTVKPPGVEIPSFVAPIGSSPSFIELNSCSDPEEFSKAASVAKRDHVMHPDGSEGIESFDFESLTVPTESSKLLANPDEQYTKKTLDKLMDYSSSRLAILDVLNKSQEFNKRFVEAKKKHIDCSKEIDYLTSEIKDFLTKNQGNSKRLIDLNEKIEILRNRIKNEEDDLKKSLAGSRNQVDEIDRKIADATQDSINSKTNYDRIR